MKIKVRFKEIALMAVLVLYSVSAKANYDYRFSLGAGIAQFNNPSQSYFELGAEFEYRLQPILGLGAFGNYIFSTPGITLLGFPEVFFHPLSTDWYLAVAPIVEFGSGIDTHFGARIGTRFPIPLGTIALIPEIAVDFINGGSDLVLGLGIEF